MAACAPVPVAINHYENTAMAFADSLNRFTNRFSGSESIFAAKDFIIRNMRNTANIVEVQSHNVRLDDTTEVVLNNIMCRFYPNYDKRVLVYSNYDQDPDSGDSTDCSSGTALLMSLSRYIADNDPGIGVDIVFLTDVLLVWMIQLSISFFAFVKDHKHGRSTTRIKFPFINTALA